MKKGTRNHLILCSTLTLVILLFALSVFPRKEFSASDNTNTEKAWRVRTDKQKISERISLKEKRRLAGLPEKVQPSRHPAAIEKLYQGVQDCLTSGAVHSVNVEFNEVRIAPELWQALPIESKQGFVYQFSKYFDSKGSTGRVTILSSRSDKKLATYGSWRGMRILE